MFREQLPRLYDLKDLAQDSHFSYFRDFETKLKNFSTAFPFYTRLEKKLQYLESDAWEHLKSEASKYLTCKTNRGWPQLLDILCQADGYKRLKDLGCSGVKFIPRADREGQKTPDLEGWLSSQRVLCEVKRINISDAESRSRNDDEAGTYEPLNRGFFCKLQSSIAVGKGQIQDYDPQGDARHLVYVNIAFDEGSGFNRADELRQVEQHLNDNPPGIEVVCNAWI